MSALLILAVVVLGIQVVIFFMSRARKRKMEQPSEIEKKFGIYSRADAWRTLNSQDLSEAERIEVEELYKKL